ncbi:bifunctional protein-serine/threonine kinase/phosphatase [Photobacterium profundum]|nr:bifunctional protein-serine/threonine kinase/phosphatase [Photobacterium profundum]
MTQTSSNTYSAKECVSSSDLNKIEVALNTPSKQQKSSLFSSNKKVENRLHVAMGGYSIAGVRPVNQDAFSVKLPSNNNVVKYKGIVACIADGVSCSENAQQASQTSVTQFIDEYYSTPDSWNVKKSASTVLTSLNQWLYQHGQYSDLRHNGLVTTFSGVVLKSNTAHLIHVGDSRIYRYRQGKLILLTRDHCRKQKGRNSFLTRALGMDSHLEVDYQQKSIEKGDIFFLSTDGVHEWLSNNEITALIYEGKKENRDREQQAKAIIAQAQANGSDDNLSCLLLEVLDVPSLNIEEAYNQLTEKVIPPILKVGNTIDNLKVVDVIHSGTRSHVYLVKKIEDNAEAAHYILKAPSPNFAEDLLYLEGFTREHWVGCQLNNASIMKIYDHNTSSPFLYHLCEYVEGQSLRQWMYDNPKPSFESVRIIAKGMIKAIRVFQRMEMVHRDLKPENIMLAKDGRIVIIDFGTVQVDGLDEIASPVSEDVPMGSVDYIAPEYLAGERAQHQSDIFSIGVILFEMLTGKLPYVTRPSRVVQSIPHQDWHYISACQYREDIPFWLDITLKKACQPSPKLRYQAMSELQQDFTSPNPQIVAEYDKSPLIKRYPISFWKVVSLVLLVIVLAEGYFLMTIS